MLVEILLTLFLVALNGFFVAAEFAIVKVRSSQIETSGKSGGRVSGVAKKIVGHLDAYLAATQLGITLASLGLGWIGEGVVSKLILRLFDRMNLELSENAAHNIALPIAFACITVMHIVFGELAPKSLAIRYPSRTTFAVALPLQVFYYVFRPFIWVLNGFANLCLRLVGIRPVHNAEVHHTEEELKVIIQESAESGAIRHIEQGIVERVFVLGDRKVSELMTHRTDLVWLDIDDDLRTVKEKIGREIHAVYPVCRGNTDHLEGVLSVRELFPLDLFQETFQLKDHLREAVMLVENTPAYKVLERFKLEKFHYGMVVDEFGMVQGMVSMDDVVDALLGDVAEYNQEEYRIVEREDGSWLADAKLPFFVFLEYFDLAEDETVKGINTLAGFVLRSLERIPATGESFVWRDLRFEVVDIDGSRIDKVLIERVV